MHDLDRMKAKVEIRLGATQVTALAVGTAVFLRFYSLRDTPWVRVGYPLLRLSQISSGC